MYTVCVPSDAPRRRRSGHGRIGLDAVGSLARPVGVDSPDSVHVASLQLDAVVRVRGLRRSGVVLDRDGCSRRVDAPVAPQNPVAGDGVVLRIVRGEGYRVVGHFGGQSCGRCAGAEPSCACTGEKSRAGTAPARASAARAAKRMGNRRLSVRAWLLPSNCNINVGPFRHPQPGCHPATSLSP